MEEKERETHRHPSFGQLQISRVNGNANFYGSELTQQHYIALRVYKSEVHRDLSRDWYHNIGLPYIEIRMSAGQFAEAITSLNNGSGTPCTVEMVDGKPIEEMPQQESRKEFVHRKFEDRMRKFSVRLKEQQSKARELVKKKTLSKEDMHQLNMHLNWLTQEIESNIPFFAKCFQETMDTVVFEAKNEVENALQHKINSLGLLAYYEAKKSEILSENND